MTALDLFRRRDPRERFVTCWCVRTKVERVDPRAFGCVRSAGAMGGPLSCMDAATLSEEAERCERRRAGAIFIWDNRETQTPGLEKIEAQFFALVGGSPGAEIVFLNQNLAVRSTSIFRDFDGDFLGPLSHGLLDFVHQPRDRLRLVKFYYNALDCIRTRTYPTRNSGSVATVECMLDRVGWVL